MQCPNACTLTYVHHVDKQTYERKYTQKCSYVIVYMYVCIYAGIYCLCVKTCTHTNIQAHTLFIDEAVTHKNEHTHAHKNALGLAQVRTK
jgi:hypothetical protein